MSINVFSVLLIFTKHIGPLLLCIYIKFNSSNITKWSDLALLQHTAGVAVRAG